MHVGFKGTEWKTVNRQIRMKLCPLLKVKQTKHKPEGPTFGASLHRLMAFLRSHLSAELTVRKSGIINPIFPQVLL